MNTLRILEPPVAFHKCLADLVGSITGALLLSQAVYWQNRCKNEDGWWWKTQEQWEDETGMTRRELETARKSCSEFIDHEVRGIPARSWYRVNLDALQTRLSETAKQACTKQPNMDGSNRQTTNDKTSSETTPKNAGAGFSGLFELTEKLRTSMNVLFRRKVNDPWDYSEEHALTLVARRPNVAEELSLVEKFVRRAEKPPRSVDALLNAWGHYVDQARFKPKEQSMLH